METPEDKVARLRADPAHFHKIPAGPVEEIKRDDGTVIYIRQPVVLVVSETLMDAGIARVLEENIAYAAQEYADAFIAEMIDICQTFGKQTRFGLSFMQAALDVYVTHFKEGHNGYWQNSQLTNIQVYDIIAAVHDNVIAETNAKLVFTAMLTGHFTEVETAIDTMGFRTKMTP